MERMTISGEFCDMTDLNMAGQEGDFLPIEMVDDEGEREMIIMEMFSLPTICRVILLARYYMRFNYNQMASVLETSPRRAKMYLASAETMLKWRIEEQLGRELPYAYCADREPMLARLYRKDAETTVTPEVCGRINQHAHDYVS